jgi:uncharacterized protein with FMN-binding domain
MLTQDKIRRPSRMGKWLLSSGLILASAGYAMWQQQAPPPAPLASSLAPPHPARRAVAAPVRVAPVAIETPPPVSAVPAPFPKVKEASHPLAQNPPTAVASAVPPAAPAPAQAPANAAPPPAASEPTTVYASDVPHYADGEYVGASMDTEWGPIQVEAIIRNGAIADVKWIDFPTHRERSAEISRWAAPLLTSEAIQIQNWEVDAVSQASFTSEGFQQSLQSALMRAHK